MPRFTMTAGGLALALAVASTTQAQPLYYLGKEPQAATGWIELGQEQYREIGVGSEVPGWGRVREVHNDRLIVEQVQTEAERRRRQEQGALDYDVLEIHIMRQDLRHPERALPRGPR